MKESRHAIQNPANESPEPDDDLSFDLWDEDLAGRLGLLPGDPPDREILIAETIRGDQVTIRFPYEQGDWDPEEEVSHVLVRLLDEKGRPRMLVESWAQWLTIPACMLARMDNPQVRSLLRTEDVELGITYPVGYELIRTDIGDAEAERLLEVPNSVGILEIWQAYFGAYGELVLVQRSCLVPGDSIRNPRHLRWEWEARRKGFLVHNPFQQDGGVNLPLLDGRTQS